MEIIIPQYDLVTMDTFDAVNHCALTSLTAIFSYYHKIGYHRIDSNPIILFEEIRNTALSKHFYFPNPRGIIKGTLPYFIDNLARHVWKKYHYPHGSSRNKFVFWNKSHFIEIIKREIKANRPLLLSMSYGIYKRHSVTVYGYTEKVVDDKLSFQLIINDNWSLQKRFLAVDSFWNTTRMFVEVCLIFPEKFSYKSKVKFS